MVQASILACEDSLQMVRARAAVEECHARNLTKISSMELRYCKGSLQDSMDQLKSDIKHKATQHVVLAENITQDIYGPILDLKTQLLSRQKSLLTQYANIKRDMKKLEDNYLKSWTAFDKSYADAHYQWTVCKATGASEPFLTPDMFKDLRSSSSSSTNKSQESSTRTSPQRSKTKSTLKSTLSGVTSSISGISPASWMSGAAAAPSNAPNSGSGAASATSSSGSVLTFAAGSNLLSSALSSSSSTLNAIVNKNLTGKDLLDWALSGANNITSGAEPPISTATAADTTHATAVLQLQHAERLRRKCLEHWQVFVNATQRAAIKVQIILTKLQGMVETFQILMSEYLKKMVVFECSAIANQQYDLQMLFKVFESVDSEADLVGFMSQNNTAFRPTENPKLSEMIPTVTPPGQLPPPPCATLLACPVTKSAPYVKEEEKLFALRLPLLVRPLPPPVEQQSPPTSSEQQQPPPPPPPPPSSHREALNDYSSPSTEERGCRSSTGYGQAEDVLKHLVELSNSLRKQKGKPPQPLTSGPTSLNNNSNNSSNKTNAISVHDSRNSTSDGDEEQRGVDSGHTPPLPLSLSLPLPLPPQPASSIGRSECSSSSSSSSGSSSGSGSSSDVDSSTRCVDGCGCADSAVDIGLDAGKNPMSVEITSANNPPSLAARTATTVPTTPGTIINIDNNTENKQSEPPHVPPFPFRRQFPSEPATLVDASLLNPVEESYSNDIDEGVEGEEELTGDPDREEQDPLWTLPSKSSVISKETLITYIQSPVFSDAKLLQALALPRTSSSPLTTRSLGNLDGIEDEVIKDQDDAVEGEEVI